MPLTPQSVPLSGWGRYPVVECQLVEPDTAEEITRLLPATACPAIARGNGRSYGDSSLSRPSTIGMRRLDRMLAFDEAAGVLTCEGGVLLADIVELFVPRGWFPAVTPGTKYVTVGGMIASDTHGKNHHLAGSFCEYVLCIDLALGDGSVLRCSPAEHPELFAATCGGMGLTGIILRAAFRLTRIATSRIKRTIVRAPNLDCAIDTLDASGASTYSVAWIDCLASGTALGRSAVILGEPATLDDLDLPDRSAPFARPERSVRKLPVDFPSFVLNRYAVRLFNSLYYRSQRPGTALVDIDPYFYPLDALLDWNRIYGRGGFVQYQCVLPLAASRGGLAELLTEITRTRTGSFLAVLKRLGRESFGYLSFPLEGYTLALDFPVSPETLALLDRLDAIIERHGGRLYLAKDARASGRTVALGYPRLDAFREVRRRYGVDRRFRSVQAERLGL